MHSSLSTETCTRDSSPVSLSTFSMVAVMLYLDCGLGVEGGKNASTLEHLRQVLVTLGLPFLVMADFNATPAERDEAGWFELFGAVPVTPGNAKYTCDVGSKRGARLGHDVHGPPSAA